MEAALTLIALTVMVVLRDRLGYRIIGPIRLPVMALVMFLVAAFAHRTPNAVALQLFAGLVLVIGLGKKFACWLDLQRGNRRHSFYVGDSVLQFQWLPGWLRRNRRVSRFGDPLVCMASGIALWHIAPALGSWLFVSGFSLRFVENLVYRQEFQRDLNTLDGLVLSESQAETVERFSEPAPEMLQQQDSADAVSTGLSPELQNRIAQRKNRISTP